MSYTHLFSKKVRIHGKFLRIGENLGYVWQIIGPKENLKTQNPKKKKSHIIPLKINHNLTFLFFIPHGPH
jgi:hypothetical protein